LGELPETQHRAHFDINRIPRTINPTGHAVLLQKLDKARQKFESSPFNSYVGPDKADLLIITCGACWLYSNEAVRALKLEGRVGILKLGTLWPLPEKFVERHVAKSQKVLVAEEIDPFLEQNVMELVATMPPNCQHPMLYGKHSGHIKAYGEQNPDAIIHAISDIMGLTYQPRDINYTKKAENASKSYMVMRSGTLCAGCPHKASYWAIKNALRLDGRYGFVAGDIGCYVAGEGIGGFFQSKTTYCMGAGAGIATGLGKLGQFGFDHPVIAACGDSTFYHAAIPAIINGIYNNSNFIVAVFDNNSTAMTGHQPHPGSGMTAMGDAGKVVSIEALCRSMGVRVEVCDPFDLKNATGTLLDMMAMDGGVRVIIMRRECELIRARKEKPPHKVHIDPDKCVGEACGCNRLCTRVFRCPGLRWNKEAEKSEIDEFICSGCGVCADICPQGAIVREAVCPRKH